MTRQQDRAENRHRRKLFGGRMTAEEVHQSLAFPPGTKCNGCGRPPLIRIITMMEMEEARKNPQVDALMMADPVAFMQNVVPIKGGDGLPKPYLRTGVAYACKSCAPAAEKIAAKAPSHCIVEINRGPGPDKIIC